MIYTAKAKTQRVGKGLQIKGTARDLELILDEPVDEGGTNEGMNPVEAVLCALGSCQAITAEIHAKSQNFSYDDLWIELEGDMDTRGMKGANGVPRGFQEIRYTVHFKTKESKEKAEAFMDFVESRCPVGDMLRHGVRLVRVDVVVNS